MVLGMVQTNTWFVLHEETKELILVDPADDAARIIQKIEENEWKLQAILLTHGHFDHIGAVDDLRAHFKGVQCYAGEDEKEVLENGSYNLSASFGSGFAVRADHLLKDKETLTLAGFKLQVIETPGHTKGGVCYYLPQEGVLFSGDTLFHASVGRFSDWEHVTDRAFAAVSDRKSARRNCSLSGASGNNDDRLRKKI